MRRYPEAARGDLFDLGNPIGAETRRVFSTLATVRSRADLIHAHRKGFMGFGGEGSQRHARGIKPLENIFNGLNCIKLDAFFGQIELEQIPQSSNRPHVAVIGITLVIRIIPCRYRLLKRHDHIGVEGMVFPTVHILK